MTAGTISAQLSRRRPDRRVAATSALNDPEAVGSCSGPRASCLDAALPEQAHRSFRMRRSFERRERQKRREYGEQSPVSRGYCPTGQLISRRIA
jgi:hypothetical protein